MADVKFIPLSQNSAPEFDASESSDQPVIPHADIMSLLFFAYRDFVGRPDEILASMNFGRAHHRVIHFVNINPGLRVSDLLDILKITKQSLSRVLKQLVQDGYVEQRPGPVDRRERLLFMTGKGRIFAARLAESQAARIEKALVEIAPEDREVVRRFLRAMVDEAERARVDTVIPPR
ncbi:MAG: MarR family transcriptional regulator [Pseudomonadota bacterium]